MSSVSRMMLTRAGIYVVENPKDIALLYLTARYIPGGTQKIMRIGIESGKYYGRISGPSARFALATSRILIGSTNVARIGAAATATRAAVAAGAAIGAGAVIGYGLGAGVGTGLGYLMDGSRGANAARDLYTFQVSPKQYFETVGSAIGQVISK
jgi:hypothetical protein